MDEIIYILIGVLILILGYFSRNGRKIGKFKYYDAAISDIRREDKKISVSYSVDNREYIYECSPTNFKWKSQKQELK